MWIDTVVWSFVGLLILIFLVVCFLVLIAPHDAGDGGDDGAS